MASWVFSTASLMAVSRAYCPRTSGETIRQATTAASATRFHSFLIVHSPCSATRPPQSARERRHDRQAEGGGPWLSVPASRRVWHFRRGLGDRSREGIRLHDTTVA